MRILETCIAAWPVPEMQPRIDAFKEAFSADSSRPFELKRSFPYGSPSSSGTFQPSPSPDGHMNHPILVHHDPHMQSTQLSYRAQPITPPVSAGFDTSKENPISSASMPLMPTAQQHHLPLQTSSIDVGWNPAPIFRCVSATGLHYEEILTLRQFLEHCVWIASHRHGFSFSPYASAFISSPLSSFISLINDTLNANTSIVPRTILFYAFRYVIPFWSPDRTTTTCLCKPSAFVRHLKHVARHCC
jgi:hypothetical protein